MTRRPPRFTRPRTLLPDKTLLRTTMQAAAGHDHAKAQPTCIVAAIKRLVRPRYVRLLPLTHTPPTGDTVGVEIPPKVKQALRLDDEPSWVIVSEHNVDEWPIAGVSAVPGTRDGFAYGLVPPGLFRLHRARVLEPARRTKAGAARR